MDPAGEALARRWSRYKQEPFAVRGLPDGSGYDEADWAALDGALAGYVERALAGSGLSADEAREVERLLEEGRRRLPALSPATGHDQMATLLDLAEAARRWRR